LLKNQLARTTIVLDGRRVAEFAVWSPKAEVHVKSMLPGARVHLSFFPADGRLTRHVTHERYRKGDRRRHRQRRQISVEDLVTRALAVFFPPEEEPPRVEDVRSIVQDERLATLFGAKLLAAIHRVDDTPVLLPEGQVAAILEAGLNLGAWQSVGIQVELRSEDGELEDTSGSPDNFRPATLVQMAAEGRRVAFSTDERYVYILFDGKAIRLSWERLVEFEEWLSEALGFTGYLRTLRRQGALTSLGD